MIVTRSVLPEDYFTNTLTVYDDKEALAREAMSKALKTPFNRHDRRAIEAVRRRNDKKKVKADQRRLVCYNHLQKWKSESLAEGSLTSELIDLVFQCMLQKLFRTDYKDTKLFKQVLDKTIDKFCSE